VCNNGANTAARNASCLAVPLHKSSCNLPNQNHYIKSADGRRQVKWSRQHGDSTKNIVCFFSSFQYPSSTYSHSSPFLSSFMPFSFVSSSPSSLKILARIMYVQELNVTFTTFSPCFLRKSEQKPPSCAIKIAYCPFYYLLYVFSTLHYAERFSATDQFTGCCGV
jgi:hypothetical protein